MQIIVDVSDNYVPIDGDVLDAVTAALEFAEIPASLVTTKANAHNAIGLVRELAGINYKKLGSGTRSALDNVHRKAVLLVKD